MNQSRYQQVPRRAITLLEVLIAVGVLSIGLLALASLIPIGKYQLSEGVKMDRGSTCGRAAFRTLQVGEYLRPDMWLYPTTGVTGTAVLYGTAFQTFRAATGSSQPPLVPLVLDPLMIAANNPNSYPKSLQSAGGLMPTAASQQMVATFPYGLNSSNSGGPEASLAVTPIPRITLRNLPGPFTTGNQITLGAADRLFRGNDDLMYNNIYGNLQEGVIEYVNEAGVETQGFVSSGTYPTIQYVGAVGINNYATTMSQGDYSWLVAIQPDMAQAFGGQGFSGMFYEGNAATTRQFLVSVVVFQKRPLLPLIATAGGPGSLATMQNVDPNARGERVVYVDFISRGSVRLRTNSSVVQTIDDATKYLSVRSNEWIAVIGRRQVVAPSPYPRNQIESSIHWYQVIQSSGLPRQMNSQWFVDAVVTGDDWTQNGATAPTAVLYMDEDGFTYDDAQNTPTGIGVILTGAIGVFTKTMTLDGLSLWGDR